MTGSTSGGLSPALDRAQAPCDAPSTYQSHAIVIYDNKAFAHRYYRESPESSETSPAWSSESELLARHVGRPLRSLKVAASLFFVLPSYTPSCKNYYSIQEIALKNGAVKVHREDKLSAALRSMQILTRRLEEQSQMKKLA